MTLPFSARFCVIDTHIGMFMFFSTKILSIGDALEIGVQWSILKKDIPSFERYMAQLKPYYLDYK